MRIATVGITAHFAWQVHIKKQVGDLDVGLGYPSGCSSLKRLDCSSINNPTRSEFRPAQARSVSIFDLNLSLFVRKDFSEPVGWLIKRKATFVQHTCQLPNSALNLNLFRVFGCYPERAGSIRRFNSNRMVITHWRCRGRLAEWSIYFLPQSFIPSRPRFYSVQSLSWWYLIAGSNFEMAENRIRSLKVASILNTNNCQLLTSNIRFSNTKEYLKFKNRLKSSTKQCLLDISMLDNLEALGCGLDPADYYIPQAVCKPHKIEAPELLGFLDTESYSKKTRKDSITLKPYLLICKLEGELLVYDIVEHGKNFLKRFLSDLIAKFQKEKTKKNIFIVAHNFRGHDALLLIRSFTSVISETSCTCRVVYHSGKIYNLTIKWKTPAGALMQARFQCRLILFQGSLEKVSKSFSKNLQKFPIPHKAISSPQVLKRKSKDILLDHLESKSEKLLLEKIWKSTGSSTIIDYAKKYCQNDVDMLEYIYTKFKSEYEKALKTGKIRNRDLMTISRLAQTTWSGFIDFNEHLIANISNSTPTGKYLITAYYGGKCEVYKGFLDYGTRCYYYDYPGMYSMAIRQPIPVGVPVYMDCRKVISPQFFVSALHKSGICAYLTVKFKTPPSCHIPILPYKASLRDKIPKLIFCTGQANGTYFSYELEHAIKMGYKILKIYHGYAFNSYKTLKPYSNYMTQIKEVSKYKDDKVRTLIYKLLANSLYGKFGIQRRSRSLFTPIASLGTLSRIKQFYPIDEFISITCVHIRDTGSATNLAVAAAVASWGRIILRSGVNKVLSVNPHRKLIYVDTDSIFFQSPSEITCSGMWKKLNWSTQATYKDAKFLARKFYALKTFKNHVILKIKGVKSGLIRLRTFQDPTPRNFKVVIGKIDQWKKARLRRVVIKTIDKTITPYDSPKRRLIIKKGRWTGDTIPFNFSSVIPRSHTKFSHAPRYTAPPLDFRQIENIQVVPTPHGNSYHADKLSLIPLPSNTLFVANYLISHTDNLLTWSTLYYLAGFAARQSNTKRIGILSSGGLPGAEITLTSEYLEYPHPFNSIGSEEFELYMNAQIIYYAERYRLNSQETSEMLTEAGIVLRFLCYYVS